MDDKKKKPQMSSMQSLLLGYTLDDQGGRITREFQDYGYRLAHELEDLEHKSLYIKLAKTENREMLESARRYVSDAKVKSRARLFMWKLKELRQARKTQPKKKV